MRTIVIATVALLMPLAALSQTTVPDWKPPSGIPKAVLPPPAKATDTLSVETPMNSELDRIFNSLQNQLKDVEKLSALMKGMSAKKPADMQTQIDAAALTLSLLADKLRADSLLSGELEGLRKAANSHRQRVQEMAKDAIEEADRTALMKAWDKALMDADKLTLTVSGMRERVSTVLNKLRMRQASVGEFLLAGQFQEALNSLKTWVSELDATVTSLRAAIEPGKPAS